MGTSSFSMRRQSKRSFSLIELMIVIGIIGIFMSIGGSVFLAPFTRSYTEKQAYKGMDSFIAQSSISGISRKTCAGDSDGDGYGTCTVVLNSGEKIFLMCPVGPFNLASSCKEIQAVGITMTLE